jgi:hypothetical protein
LESVLGETPQEFESPILRHADQASCSGLRYVILAALDV